MSLPQRKFERLPFDVHDIIFMDFHSPPPLHSFPFEQNIINNCIIIIRYEIIKRENGRSLWSKLIFRKATSLAPGKIWRKKERPAVVFGGVSVWHPFSRPYRFTFLLLFSFTKKKLATKKKRERVFDLPQTSCLGKRSVIYLFSAWPGWGILSTPKSEDTIDQNSDLVTTNRRFGNVQKF